MEWAITDDEPLQPRTPQPSCALTANKPLRPQRSLDLDEKYDDEDLDMIE